MPQIFLEASKIFDELVKVRDMLQKMSVADKYTFLPPSSYHMTVIEGVCDQVRKEDYWSTHVPLDAPLEQVDQFFIEKFNTINKPESFSMIVNDLGVTKGITVRLLPKTENDAQELKRFRNEVSERLGLRFPIHDNYEFHISIAYKIYELDENEETKLNEYKENIDCYLKNHFGVFDKSFPRLLFFENMFKFSEERSFE